MQNKLRKNLVFLFLLFFSALLAFYGLYRADNKYTAALPGGAGYNVLPEDAETPAFLVDGWEYYPGALLCPADFAAGAANHTYIGRYPNFSAHLGSPYGTATYRLILKNPGAERELSLYLPELLSAVLLAGELSGLGKSAFHRRAAIPGAAALCAVSVVFPLFILPYAPVFINAYGRMLFLWKLLAGVYLIALAATGQSGGLERWLLAAAGLYGASVTAAVLTVNRFEPIRGAWPEEYGSFALVAGFAALMVRRGVLLAAENRRLTEHLQEEVARQTRALDTLLTERKRLLADLVHDVRAPLAAARNYAELIRIGGVALDSETTGYLEALAGRVEALEERFNTLRDFSQSERAEFHPEPLVLNDFLSAFYRDNRPDLELSGQNFRLCLPRERLMIEGDAALLRRALENLCYNALSFTPEDGTITLSLAREGDMALVSVSDTGTGIAPADLPHVFERSFSRRAEGSGLGLFIVRMAALLHGGTAGAASAPGKSLNRHFSTKSYFRVKSVL